jgi:hypothetical protein
MAGSIQCAYVKSAYCRGPFCLMSVDAVRLLQEAGFEAYQWREGAADWLASAKTSE